ncbi:uncharacterized protein LOC120429913 [Culex pipiens pallens]|uniref:uncharacterized protein LOC120429913 n=1 Tax=Culex pipiens pallens TaxID=42434 RepID=UPI0022AA48E2|nr:uncharacterized protein LOC120429913 [Culex pipiens pallens]
MLLGMVKVDVGRVVTWEGMTHILLFLSLTSALDPTSNNALYQCGVRRRIGVQLIERGWVAELGQWPWHAALFHVSSNGSSSYACGGTLLDQRHVLTSAHCVTTKRRKNIVPISGSKLVIHLGQYDLREITGVQQCKVSEVHIHEEYSTNRNDIAVLVLNSDVEYSDFVIPICLDNRVDPDLTKLVGQRGSVAGWGLTENQTVAQLLRTAQMPVVSHVECVQADPTLFGRYLDRGMFCAGERNGTSVCNGDSGGGFYISEGDRWVLRGVVSFSGVDENRQCDTAQYAGFANVHNYLGWIRNVTGSRDGAADKLDVPRRISEIECEKYKELAGKRGNGICLNSRQPHNVALIYEEEIWGVCSGALISDQFVLTACSCMKRKKPVSARIGQFLNIKIAKIVCHPQKGDFVNDVALIKLESKVEFAASVIPACLANDWTENLYDTLLLTGFKEDFRVYEDVPGFGKRPKITELVESVDNLIITKEECRNRTQDTGRTERITDSQLCVYSPGHEILHAYDSNGLAGGALQTYNSRTCIYSILGICADSYTAQSVTIYSRIARFLDWIEPIVWAVDDPTESDDEDGTPPEYEGNELSLGSSTEDTCTYKFDSNQLTPTGPIRKNTVVVDTSEFKDISIAEFRKLFEELQLNLSAVKSVQPHTLRNVVLIEMITAEHAKDFARNHNMKHTVMVNNQTIQIPVYLDGEGTTIVRVTNLAPRMSNDCIVEFLANFGEVVAIKDEVWGGLLAGITNGKRNVQMKLSYHIPQWVLINGEVGSVSYQGQLPHLL